MAKIKLNLKIVGDSFMSYIHRAAEELWMSMTGAITIFLKAVVRTQSIPFSLGHRMGILGCSTAEMKMSLGC